MIVMSSEPDIYLSDETVVRPVENMDYYRLPCDL